LRLLLAFLVNAAALALADFLVPGIHAEGPLAILATALVFGLVNTLIRPVLKLLSCPMIVLTLGLFTLILNALMLLLTARIGRVFGIQFTVDGFWSAFVGALIVSIVSVLLSGLVSGGKRAD
jgi:putative membrane protein